MCRLASVSISSIAVLVSDASRPLSVCPSAVRTGIDAVVAFDGAAGIDQVDEQLVLGMHGHAGEVGADLGPFAGMHVALRALVFVDELAGGGVAFLLR